MAPNKVPPCFCLLFCFSLFKRYEDSHKAAPTETFQFSVENKKREVKHPVFEAPSCSASPRLHFGPSPVTSHVDKCGFGLRPVPPIFCRGQG